MGNLPIMTSKGKREKNLERLKFKVVEEIWKIFPILMNRRIFKHITFLTVMVVMKLQIYYESFNFKLIKSFRMGIL